VFAGGDIVTGGATVILAMGAGRRAAAAILGYLDHGTMPEVVDASEPVCPRCHRPVEAGDDDGICCADQVVAWKCTDCAKRSEGFAFPYGRCPACSGTLVPVDPTGTVPDEAMDAVRKAFEIELGGRDFYVAAAKHTSDEELHDMFQRLAEMEREHIDTLVRRYHLAPPDDASGDLHPGALQAGAQRVPTDPVDLLELALTLEQRAEAFFREHLDDTSPAARELYRELAAEEGEHIALLTTEIAALQGNRRGLL
jgi:rubrerythrin